jgi:hypothetical protein
MNNLVIFPLVTIVNQVFWGAIEILVQPEVIVV